MTKQDERLMLSKYIAVASNVEELENQLKEAKAKLEEQKQELVEYLESIQADTTARYDGLGYCRLMKPQLYASYVKDNEEKVFEFLQQNGRDDLMKLTVHPSSLSSYVKERVEKGEAVPDTINYYLKQNIRIFK